PLRLHGVGGAHADPVDETSLLRQYLTCPEQNVDGGLIDGADTGVEYPPPLRADARALAGLHRQIGAKPGADLLRQPVAEDKRIGGAVHRGQRALTHLSWQRRDFGFARRIDADDAGADLAAGIAQDNLGLDRGRNRARYPTLQSRHDGQRILDATPPRLRRQAVDLGGVVGLLRRLRRWIAAFVGD